MKIRNGLFRIIMSLIASLPFRLLYLVSDGLYVVVYYLIRYRRQVTYDNIRKSFPEKNEREINQIAKTFYQNLCDLVVEVIKSKKLPRSQLIERVTFSNEDIFEKLYQDKQNILATTGHCGNWEWVGNRLGLIIKHEGAAIYKPLMGQFFDDYLVAQRKKYANTLMINYKQVIRSLLKIKEKLVTVFVLADQSPAIHEIDYFVNFLGRRTAFYQGTEKVARTLDYAVVYLDIQRVKRGYYQVNVQPICSHAKQTKEGEVTGKYVQMLEQSVRTNPDNWLWSHRRWKAEK